MYESFDPAEPLAPFVECYWSWSIEPDGRSIDDILPDATPELILHLASVPYVRQESNEWVKQKKAFLYCASRRGLSLSVREPMHVFAIRFRAWGVSRFSTRPMAEMLDRPVPPGEVLSSLGDDLVAGLVRCESDVQRVSLANDLLVDALRIPGRDDRRLAMLLDATEGGTCSSTAIASALAMSNRSFNRLWNDVVGIPPRHYVQLMRFHNALAMIDEGIDMATVATECGYSDQSHMARRIKAISGLTPSSLRNRLGDRAYRALYTGRPGAPWHRNVRFIGRTPKS